MIYNPYKGNVTLVADNILVVTKRGTEQYKLQEINSVSANRRKPNGSEVSKGLIKGTWGGIAGALGGALVTLGAGAPSGAALGAIAAGSVEFMPKTDFTIYFRNGETRTWTLCVDADKLDLEEVTSQINSRLKE